MMDVLIGDDVDSSADDLIDFANQFDITYKHMADRVITRDALYLSPTQQLGYLAAHANRVFYPKYPVVNQPVRRSDFSLLQSFGRCKKGFVLDLTAGFGRDSYVLYKSGYQVYSVEKSKILSAFVYYKMLQVGTAGQWVSLCGDANQIVSQYPVQWQKPDVIYIDPMFEPGLTKGAVQKTACYLRALAEDSRSIEDNFSAILDLAIKRVIVKRAKRSHYINDQQPTYQLQHNRCRFDVYVVSAKGHETC
ncbi:MAG: hypothetical protein CMF46_02685 [Legionellales bacterium]|nr:hypothetical protein [Legionellales bacterium]|tara:strand:- start:487 stop:1233 length:747 start_codon:yes stop_codon:yes gene_type:complete